MTNLYYNQSPIIIYSKIIFFKNVFEVFQFFLHIIISYIMLLNAKYRYFTLVCDKYLYPLNMNSGKYID